MAKSKKFEDFDEWSDPDNPQTIQYEQVVESAKSIKKTVLETPCIPSHYQKEFVMHLYYKMETFQKTGSFKDRGAANVLEQLPLDRKKAGITTASTGNFGASLAKISRGRYPVTIVMPFSTPISKMQKCHDLGGKVIVQGNTLVEAHRYARAIARELGFTYINGRDHPHVLAGYGTITLEIMKQIPFVDAIMVPVGSGGLAAATCAVVKHINPKCLVYGVQPERMPVMFNSLEIGEPITIPIQSTIAESLCVPSVGVNSFNMVAPLLDKLVLVKEDWIAQAMLHLYEKEKFITEGAGACALAAIIGHLVPEFKTKNVVCVISGGNSDLSVFTRCLNRGLAYEGRLVKFRGTNNKFMWHVGNLEQVGIRDTVEAHCALLRLLSKNCFNIVHQWRWREWLDGDTYYVEMDLAVEAKDLAHALELKRIVERTYPITSTFETEPFNDKTTCPCYIKKKTVCE